MASTNISPEVEAGPTFNNKSDKKSNHKLSGASSLPAYFLREVSLRLLFPLLPLFIPGGEAYRTLFFYALPGLLLITAWNLRVLFRPPGETDAASDGRGADGKNIKQAHIYGVALFSALQYLWVLPILPPTAPLWFWPLILLVSFILFRAPSRSRGLNPAPAIVTLVLALFYQLVNFYFFSESSASAPGLDAACFWSPLADATGSTCGASEVFPGLALFTVLGIALIQPGRYYSALLLIFLFTLPALFREGFGPSYVALGPIALLLFMPGAPRRGLLLWGFYGLLSFTGVLLLHFYPLAWRAFSVGDAVIISLIFTELLFSLSTFIRHRSR